MESDALLNCPALYYQLAGLSKNPVVLLKTALRLLEQNQAYAVWRLLDYAERSQAHSSVELDLFRARALELCGYRQGALELAERTYQLQTQRQETTYYILQLYAKLLPSHAVPALKFARACLRQQDSQCSILALQLMVQLEIAPIGACYFDGVTITGWLLDAPSLPALTVTIDGNDFKLTPFLATDTLAKQGLGSGKDGFALTVPPGRFHTIRIHLNGLDLVGSPIQLVKPGAKTPVVQSITAKPVPDPKACVDIIVPVYKGLAETKACLAAVLQAKNTVPYRLIVVEDASPEPRLVAFLLELSAKGKIMLLRQPVNTGFVGAVNAGLQLSQQDVVLLNADTCVHGDWLDRLQAVAYQNDKIGSVTPLSNNAELLSFPVPMQVAGMPDAEMLAKLDQTLADLNSPYQDIPSGVGFCLYIKRHCLNTVGFLDASLIERGYGEDSDLCLRIAAAGWQNVCAANVFVAHAGNVSFGADKQHLVAINLPRIHERYPDHEEDYKAFLNAQPLAPVYRQLQQHLLPVYVAGKAILVVLPAQVLEPATYQYVKALVQQSGEDIYYLVLHAVGKVNCQISLSSTHSTKAIHLQYAWPQQADLLWQDLRLAGFKRLDFHTLAHWPLAILQALMALGLPYRVILHDDSVGCLPEASVVTDSFIGRVPAERLKLSNQLCRSAEKVLVPSVNFSTHYQTCYPQIQFDTCQQAIPITLQQNAMQPFRHDELLRLAVFLAATPNQGFFNLLAFAKLLAKRRLSVELVIFGETWDDQALLATGKVWLAGPVSQQELPQLTCLQACTMALHLPAIPELDGLALQMARQCGLALAAPAMGIYQELLDSCIGDIVLAANGNVDAWLQAVLSPNQVLAA
jgi:GT2 family glycosyltransferase